MKRRLPKGEETLSFESLSPEALIERVEKRIAQGREATIYRLGYELTPDDQLRHMKLGDEIGLELIEAERKLLEEELRIIEDGNA